MERAKKISAASVIFFICLWPIVALAAITVEVKPDKIDYGKTFNLIITSDKQDTSIPNLTPLQQDFHIIGTERAMSYTAINGQARAIHQFIILLMPKKQGTLTIPALKLGQEHTTPQTIQVLDTAARFKSSTRQDDSSSNHESVMIKTSIDTKTPYVGQQTVYTVKLYNSGRLLDAEYQPPSVENALLVSLGDANRYQSVEKGQNYVVEEQKYAVFPQKSGLIKITGPSFHALLQDVVPRQVNIPPAVTELNVKPAPADFKDEHWLPAKKIVLSESFDASHKQFKQGETVTRIINLEATGLPAELLPSLEIQDGKEFNVYPEKPELSNSIQQSELVGQVTLRLVYLLNKAGDITIPEFRLPWFNTQSGQTEVAKLPPHTLQVTETTSNAQKPAEPPQALEKTKDANDDHALSDAPHPPLKEKSRLNLLGWILAVGFGMAWLLTLLAWWFRPVLIHKNKKRAAIKQLHEACIRNNPVKAREALLNWAALHWPQQRFIDLNDVAKNVPDSKFKRQLNLLSKAIYSSAAKARWEGSELWLGIAAFRKKKSAYKSKPGDLPPINP